MEQKTQIEIAKEEIVKTGKAIENFASVMQIFYEATQVAAENVAIAKPGELKHKQKNLNELYAHHQVCLTVENILKTRKKELEATLLEWEEDERKKAETQKAEAEKPKKKRATKPKPEAEKNKAKRDKKKALEEETNEAVLNTMQKLDLFFKQSDVYSHEKVQQGLLKCWIKAFDPIKSSFHVSVLGNGTILLMETKESMLAAKAAMRRFCKAWSEYETTIKAVMA